MPPDGKRRLHLRGYQHTLPCGIETDQQLDLSLGQLLPPARLLNTDRAAALLADLGEPLMSVSLIMPGEELPLTDPYEMREILDPHVDLVIDGGFCGLESTTVIRYPA